MGSAASAALGRGFGQLEQLNTSVRCSQSHSGLVDSPPTVPAIPPPPAVVTESTEDEAMREARELKEDDFAVELELKLWESSALLMSIETFGDLTAFWVHPPCRANECFPQARKHALCAVVAFSQNCWRHSKLSNIPLSVPGLNSQITSSPERLTMLLRGQLRMLHSRNFSMLGSSTS
ncbi:hypothetical protein FA15DRAFT_676613 [Coprinopsis marcescibilis]|uniref:Uncharacterized protein n=1 Tax=Coprinopsis marcescibilis TaxID=230819 RepID=A0A5C3K9N9_COPMA|nr:hypothetical protein FA15DRAFT_676613 [Coprinopsis marcescibilis]